MSAVGQAGSHWFDDESGRVVRPYAMTPGRTTSPDQHRLDLIAVLVTERDAGDPETDPTLSPELMDMPRLCRGAPQSVAELATELDPPDGVVRVLIAISVPPAELPDESILREVINGLRALTGAEVEQ